MLWNGDFRDRLDAGVQGRRLPQAAAPCTSRCESLTRYRARVSYLSRHSFGVSEGRKRPLAEGRGSAIRYRENALSNRKQTAEGSQNVWGTGREGNSSGDRTL